MGLALNLTWRVFRNLIEIAIILLIFSRAARGFETTVIAALGLLYTSLRGIGATFGMTIIGMSKSLDFQINDIRIALGLEPLDLDAGLNIADRTMWKIGVESIFIFLIAVFCVFQLLTAY